MPSMAAEAVPAAVACTAAFWACKPWRATTERVSCGAQRAWVSFG